MILVVQSYLMLLCMIVVFEYHKRDAEHPSKQKKKGIRKKEMIKLVSHLPETVPTSEIFLHPSPVIDLYTDYL